MENMRTLAVVEAEIAAAKEALQNVRGQTTEVYARIVGYYRSVRNWNSGKREEYDHRRMFSAAIGSRTPSAAVHDRPARYELFTRSTCPNCPPVKNHLAVQDIPGTEIGVDSPEGFSRAAEKGVFSAPTVIFYDSAGRELFRSYTVGELQQIGAAAVIHA